MGLTYKVNSLYFYLHVQQQAWIRSKNIKVLEPGLKSPEYGNNLLFTWWKVAPKDNAHSKKRHFCNWRNTIGEAIVFLIQNKQKGYLEDNAISLLSQGVGIPDLFSYKT